MSNLIGPSFPKCSAKKKGADLAKGIELRVDALVRLAHELALLVIESGVEEEPIVLDLEVLVLLANSTLAQG